MRIEGVMAFHDLWEFSEVKIMSYFDLIMGGLLWVALLMIIGDRFSR